MPRKTSKKRYRWTRSKANERFAALPTERRRAYRLAFLSVKKGASITKAARDFHVDRENLSSYVIANSRFRRKKGGKLKILQDKRVVPRSVVTTGGLLRLSMSADQIEKISAHNRDVERERQNKQVGVLAKWEGEQVRDTDGNRYDLLFSREELFEVLPPNEARDDNYDEA